MPGGFAAVVFAADFLFHVTEPMALGPNTIHRITLLVLLDWPAHMATGAVAVVALIAWRSSITRAFWFSTIVASVAIDLDHLGVLLPRWMGWWNLNIPEEEVWPLHNLTTCAILWGGVVGLQGQWKSAARGAAFGVAVHLVRDAATGGLFPLWPAVAWKASLPYSGYAAALLLSAILTSRSAARRRLKSREEFATGTSSAD